MKKIIILLLFCAVSVIFSPALQAAGLSTTFSEVTLEDLEIGKTYSTKEAANLPLTVVNTGQKPIELKIELLLPQPEELKEGFQPIPELSWIKLEKTEFQPIKSREAAVTDVFISIPDDARYAGKRFQVYIWSHTTGTTIGVGLKSRLLLVIKGKAKA